MSEEKYYLDLTGRPLDGYRTEEVAAALARLLRIPRKTARNLLRGKPSRIRREFDKQKAVQLMGKIVACGAQCEVTLQGNQEDDNQAIEAGLELSEKLELEIDPPEMALEPLPARAEALPETELVPGDQAPIQSGLNSANAASDDMPAQRESWHRPDHAGSATAVNGDVAGVTGPLAGGRQRVLLGAAVAAVLLAVAVWVGLSFLSGSSPEPQQDVAAETTATKAAPETISEVAKTRQRLELLARSVRIWMIQYGAGFDPSQVTMVRMQQDLGISPQEMKDGWGTPFRYVTADERYTLISAGPDRTFGSADDLKEEKSSR